MELRAPELYNRPATSRKTTTITPTSIHFATLTLHPLLRLRLVPNYNLLLNFDMDIDTALDPDNNRTLDLVDTSWETPTPTSGGPVTSHDNIQHHRHGGAERHMHPSVDEHAPRLHGVASTHYSLPAQAAEQGEGASSQCLDIPPSMVSPGANLNQNWKPSVIQEDGDFDMMLPELDATFRYNEGLEMPRAFERIFYT